MVAGLLGDDWSDPKSLATLQLAAGLLSPGNFGQQASRGLLGYQASLGADEERRMKRAYTLTQMDQLRQQMEQRQAQIDDARRQFAIRQAISADVEAGRVPDWQAYVLRGLDPKAAAEMASAKDFGKKQPMKLAQGETVVDPESWKPLYANAKPEELPAAAKEYQFAFPNNDYPGGFNKWLLDQKAAGASKTNVSLSPTIKMGESLGTQVGPRVSNSATQTEGAVKMYDAADRIEKAIASGKVDAGPGTSATMTVRQLVQRIAGGNDENIRQTGQVIKALAQMSVEARKELQGQGQVTESEAAAVAKAESGDIDNMTIGQLGDLATLTKRASYYRAKSHQGLIDTMSANDATKGLVPFYQVQGSDRLLQTTPKLPQIGGNAGVRNKADAILKGQ